jgi:hypothetical protein
VPPALAASIWPGCSRTACIGLPLQAFA